MNLETSAGELRNGWRSVALTALGLTCAPATLPVYTLGILVASLNAEFHWNMAAIQTTVLFSTGLGRCPDLSNRNGDQKPTA